MSSPHPDIEIYIKSTPIEAISAWLEQRFGSLAPWQSKGLVHTSALTWQGQKIPITLHEKVAGKAWMSLWFQSNQTPWSQDLDCAQEAATALNTQIRCIVSGWQEGDEPDEWWSVEQGEATKVLWRTE
ncbi:hypothetical protein [Nitrincola tapanii]|uniref:Uncharacterized protein n=1 Tax=Nitrincola tapanii TaxID=1708751 RepID=A0A5A9W1V3_9GAMM|nr:hypothetical protein [Nitrincola tapanii]KAA0874706.1 hypothetical protein E1H14_07770 [Nitrincola tapanii]